MKPILLFDLGDTLIRYYQREEFPPILQEGIQGAKEAVEQAGCVVPSEAEIQRRVAAENHEAKNSRVRPLEKRLAYIFGVKHHTSDRAWWLPICRAFLVPIFAIAEIYEDTLPALDAYREKGYRIGILSNCPWGAPSEPWFDELRRHGLLERCELAIFCSDVGWRKPAQPMFRQALAHFRCESQACLFIGDNPRWDTLGAQRAGMISVLIDRTGQANTNADFQIQSLLQLTGILEHIEYKP